MNSLNPFRFCRSRSARRSRGARQSSHPRRCNSGFERLEDRTLLVLGAFDIPAAIGPGEGFDGVVQLEAATGSLLSTQRHILTADHVIDDDSNAGPKFTVLTPSGAVRTIETPVLAKNPHGTADLEVVELAELAPLTVDGWDIYTESDEVGNVATLVGYGMTGTGTTGNATAIKEGPDANHEVVRLTISGNPTGGFFWLSHEDTIVRILLRHDPTAQQIADAVTALTGAQKVDVRKVGDTLVFNDGVVDNPGHPYAGSFEIRIAMLTGDDAGGAPASDFEVPQLQVSSLLVGGDVMVETLLEGGSPREKRMGRNLIGNVTDGTVPYLQADFDDGTDIADDFYGLGDGNGQGANESFHSAGDSGAPVFIDGLVAGVHRFRTGPGVDLNFDNETADFGEVDNFVRVSHYAEDFIQPLLDEPFDLVLNMNNQPWGNDGSRDLIRVLTAFDTLFILIDEVLYYSEPINLIESVTVLGSSDGENITIHELGDGIPVQVAGGEGDDLIELQGLSDAHATLVGDGGDDHFVVGSLFGSISSSFVGTVSVFGGIGDDDLRLDDRIGSGDHNYRIEGSIFTMSSYPGWVSYSAVEEITLVANDDDNTIRIPSTPFDTTVLVDGNEGDDVFRVGGGDIDTNIGGDVHIQGNLGADILVLLDQQDAAGGDTHNLNVASYTKTDYDHTILFSGVQEIRLRTGATQETVEVFGTSADLTRLLIDTDGGGDTVRLHATHPNTMADIRTRAGNDLVELTPTSGDLSLIGGYVVVDGGNGSSDDLVINDHNGIADAFYSVHANVVTRSSGPQIDYSQVESLALRATPFDDQIVIESVFGPTQVIVEAGAGLDMLQVPPASQQLLFVQGPVFFDGQDGADIVVVHDEQNPSIDAPLTIQDDLVTRPGFALHYEDAAELIVLLGGPNDTVDIQSTAPGMHVLVNAAGGNDTVLANVPPDARLTLDGNTGADSVVLTGRPADDRLSVSAGFGTADVNLISFEDAQADLAGGTDTLRFQGIPGQDDEVEVHASSTTAEGLVRVGSLLDLAFENTEIIDLLANPGDADTAAFIGTDQDDELAINLAAAGNAIDPVLQLFDPQSLALLLTLRDYANFGTLSVLGGDGVDEFNVYVAPAGPGAGRDLRIDGGEPSGNGNNRDELNVFRSPPNPDIDHDHDNQNDSGTFDVSYDAHQFFIEYFNIEKAVSKSAAAG